MSANVSSQPTPRPALDRRLEGIGWALFLIMIGGIGLVPNVPPSTWLVGTGLIMLGLNLARSLNHLPVSGFTVVLGTLALILGVGGMTGADLPFFPILLILIGADILAKVATRHE
jgi:hypothetical protein